MSKYKGELVFAVMTAALATLAPPLLAAAEQFSDQEDLSDTILADLWNDAKFVDREVAEEDATTKQLIPYCLIYQGGKLLTYTRGKVGAEPKLHAKKSIGVGGHINPDDVAGLDVGDGFYTALLRELEEEIGISKEQIHKLTFCGLVNDDVSEVGSVHLGMVFAAILDPAATLSFEDCLVDAEFVELTELREPSLNHQLEDWSRIITEAFA